jgi:beta-phosphoglucomutase
MATSQLSRTFNYTRTSFAARTPLHFGPQLLELGRFSDFILKGAARLGRVNFMIEIVLLDFNGVIIDDEPIQWRAYQQAFAPEGLTLTEEEYNACFGMDDHAFIRNAYARVGRTVGQAKLIEVMEHKTATHREMISGDLPLFPGVETFIRGLRRRFGIGLVSMARRVEIDYVLERAQLVDAFDAIVSAEDVQAHKPSPECYLLGLQRVAPVIHKKGNPTPPPRNCAVIEDTPAGIQSALNAGMHAIGVSNSVSAEELRSAGAEVVFPNLNDANAETVYSLFR